ncbi:MAG: DUF4147 domain-containing protein [Clostridia bacterium]|nr:DUF4147 domain-containing protein [Clostridia bacterium]
MSLHDHAQAIIRAALDRARPDDAVRRALEGVTFGPGRLVLLAVGKAAWTMANAACELLGERIDEGLVITKHGHSRGPLPRLTIREAGHPVPDAASFAATAEAMALARDLKEEDCLLFLLSGGGSALLECPLVPEQELFDLTRQLLASGADLVEINTVRKRLSAVKGGRFARLCAPAKVLSIVLSDILGDPLDMIASGPAYPDSSTCEDALAIAKKYDLALSEQAQALLMQETPKQLDNVETHINGSVRELCAAAAKAAKELGYEPVFLTDHLCCQAKEAGSFLASIVKSHADTTKPLAFIAGGETVVKLVGKGLGGRNQELALAAAEGIVGIPGAAVFSVGSDGTDGPTDAAGGYADSETAKALAAHGLTVHGVLSDNDAFHALEKTGGLIMTGPTGTNVNDVAVALINPGF